MNEINHTCENFEFLENFDNELNKQLTEYDKDKNISVEDGNYLSYSRLLGISETFTNENINSPFFLKSKKKGV